MLLKVTVNPPPTSLNTLETLPDVGALTGVPIGTP